MREQSRKEGAPRNTAGRQRGRIAARDRSKQQEPTRHTHARRNQPHPCRQTTEASLSSLSYVEGTPEDVYKERDGNQLVSERVRVCARLVTCNPCKTEITKGQKLSKLKPERLKLHKSPLFQTRGVGHPATLLRGSVFKAKMRPTAHMEVSNFRSSICTRKDRQSKTHCHCIVKLFTSHCICPEIALL